MVSVTDDTVISQEINFDSELKIIAVKHLNAIRYDTNMENTDNIETQSFDFDNMGNEAQTKNNRAGISNRGRFSNGEGTSNVIDLTNIRKRNNSPQPLLVAPKRQRYNSYEQQPQPSNGRELERDDYSPPPPTSSWHSRHPSWNQRYQSPVLEMRDIRFERDGQYQTSYFDQIICDNSTYESPVPETRHPHRSRSFSFPKKYLHHFQLVE